MLVLVLKLEIRDTVRVEPRFASQRRRLCEEGCCVCLKSEGNAKVISGFAKGCVSVLKSIR